jgi:hypothetical protein
MKHAPKNKARAVQPGRSPKKEACPICRVPFTPGVGLASHIRFKHGKAPQAAPVASNKALPREAGIQLLPIIDAETHLQTAIEQLTARQSQIDQDLGRMEGLQTEKRDVSKRIEALTTARKAFAQESMAASG